MEYIEYWVVALCLHIGIVFVVYMYIHEHPRGGSNTAEIVSSLVFAVPWGLIGVYFGVNAMFVVKEDLTEAVHDRTAMRRIEESFASKQQVFADADRLKLFALPEQVASGLASGYLRGQVVILRKTVGDSGATVDPLSMRLREDVRPTNPEKVGTVVGIYVKTEKVGSYYLEDLPARRSHVDAKRDACLVLVWHLTKAQLVGAAHWQANAPPKKISSHELSKAHQTIQEQRIRMWINALPRIPLDEEPTEPPLDLVSLLDSEADRTQAEDHHTAFDVPSLIGKTTEQIRRETTLRARKIMIWGLDDAEAFSLDLPDVRLTVVYHKATEPPQCFFCRLVEPITDTEPDRRRLLSAFGLESDDEDYSCQFVTEKGALSGVKVIPDGQSTGDLTSFSSPVYRQWADRSGRLSVEAAFSGISEDGQKITLVRGDKTEVVVSLERLSDRDQEWIRKWTANRAFGTEISEAYGD